jgi:hypothetical protein
MAEHTLKSSKLILSPFKKKLKPYQFYIFLLYENIPCFVAPHNNLLKDEKSERWEVQGSKSFAFSLKYEQCLTMAHDVVYLKTNVKCNIGSYNDKWAS